MASSPELHLLWAARAYALRDMGALPASLFEGFRAVGEQVTIRAGDHLFQQGDASEHGWFLEAGEVEVSRRAGRVTVPLAHLCAPTLFGDLEAFCELPRLSSARAVTESSARRMNLEDLEGLLLGTQGLARQWMSMCLGVLFWSQEQVTRLLGSTSVQRIALLLGAWGDEVRLSQDEMATLIGADRASVNRAIRTLGDAGAVVSGYRYLRLVDPAAVRRIG